MVKMWSVWRKKKSALMFGQDQAKGRSHLLDGHDAFLLQGTHCHQDGLTVVGAIGHGACAGVGGSA